MKTQFDESIFERASYYARVTRRKAETPLANPDLARRARIDTNLLGQMPATITSAIKTVLAEGDWLFYDEDLGDVQIHDFARRVVSMIL